MKFPGRKGVAWINGFNLGRYWNIGPGDALYVPAPVLRRGRNEIVIFELHDLNAFEVELRPSATGEKLSRMCASFFKKKGERPG